MEKFPFEGLLNSLAPKPPKADDPKTYYALLGRFITAFASAEAAVHLVARKFSGMSDSKARIVFDELRLPKLTNRVRGMMRADGADKETFTEVDACLGQLNLIADRRHRIVHRSSSYLEGQLLVTNVLTSRSLPAETETISLQALRDLYQDCLSIFIRLSQILDPKPMSDDERKVYYEPWRYKPAPPKTRNPRPQKARKLRKRLLSASQP